MDLNYHHLRYFWAVARDGSVVRASERLHVAMPTISGQIKQLERSLGGALFRRVGRQLEMTELGRHIYGYAEEIFNLGDDLVNSLQGDGSGRPVPFTIGIANVVPKLIAYRLIQPALTIGQEIELVVYEDEPDRLLANLAIHRLDLVISDAPIPPHVNVRAYNHELGRSAVGIFAIPKLARQLKRQFPASLDGAPFLAPTEKSVMSGDLERWFETHGIKPRVIGRFENSALLKVFAGQGHGCFAAPLAVTDHLRDQHNAVLIGEINDVTDRYYAISVERRIKHPAVAAVCDEGRRLLR
ncbi:MAG: transcriptional activator NhaR [Planctomycetota bacterium]|jgi:LysR family transcriptional activator of nhaA|nr:transcriptional activator NhaR [Planctomycetota bacterium]